MVKETPEAQNILERISIKTDQMNQNSIENIFPVPMSHEISQAQVLATSLEPQNLETLCPHW